MKGDQKILNLAENCLHIIKEVLQEKNIEEKGKLKSTLKNDLDASIANKTAAIEIARQKLTGSVSNDEVVKVAKMENDLIVFIRGQKAKNELLVTQFVKFQLETKRKSENLNKFILRFQFTYKWCDKIYYKKIIDREKSTSKIFVELDLYLQLKRTLDPINNGLISINKMLEGLDQNIVIQGGPGYGKTTISQHLTYEILRQEKDWTLTYTFPIVIRFRDLDYSFIEKKNSYGLFSVILDYFGVRLKLDAERKGDYEAIAGEILVRIIEENNCFLILDGFDEIPNLQDMNAFLVAVNFLSNKIYRGRMLLTSRTGIIYSGIQNSHTYEIAPLNEEQIELFIVKWFNDKQLSDKLYKEISIGHYKNVISRPLNLASICALYEKVPELPKKPRDLNKRLIDLLLKDWDQEREISRPSNYLEFPYERKLDFLRNIAYLLTVKYKKTVFTLDDIRSCYENIYDLFELPPSEVGDVIDEIESHNGLFVQGGFSTYEFAHKSFQEFLVGEYISKAMFLDLSLRDIFNVPNEMAIAVAISYNPHAFLANLFFQKMNSANFDTEFTQAFLIRLIEEKPDYRSSALLAAAIAWIYDNLKAKENSIDTIDTLIESNRNIQLSFADLSNFYLIREVEEKINSLKESARSPDREVEVVVHKAFPLPYAGTMMIPERLLLNDRMLFYYFTYS